MRYLTLVDLSIFVGVIAGVLIAGVVARIFRSWRKRSPTGRPLNVTSRGLVLPVADDPRWTLLPDGSFALGDFRIVRAEVSDEGVVSRRRSGGKRTWVVILCGKSLTMRVGEARRYRDAVLESFAQRRVDEARARVQSALEDGR